MTVGVKDANSSSLEETLVTLPAALRGFFQKVMDRVSQQSLGLFVFFH